MPKFDPQRFLSIVAASYGKRFLEKPYDRLAQTEFFQKLKDQPQLAKQAIEAASYALTALFEQKAVDSSPFWRSVNNILEDLAPELSKRMQNGDTRPITLSAEKYTAELPKPEDKLFLQILLEELGLKKTKLLANWIKTATPQEKSNILKYIKGLSAEKAVDMVKISTADASEIFVAFEEPKIEPPKGPGIVSEFLSPFRRDLIERAKKRRGGSSVQ